jgi:hypothetical protein
MGTLVHDLMNKLLNRGVSERGSVTESEEQMVQPKDGSIE